MRWAFEDWYIDFYPRSPCGERHKSVETITVNFTFLSTLSLRRATRPFCMFIIAVIKISIHALLAESDRLRRKELQRNHISIHALLAESDKDTLTDDVSTGGFLSTLSLRRATRAFLARPFLLQFLSTLSLRRATVYPGTWSGSILISIHALLAESDLRVIVSSILQTNFYPRSPCGERLAKLYYFACPFLFLSTLSLRRATLDGRFKL